MNPTKPTSFRSQTSRRTFLKTVAKAGVTAAASQPLFNVFVPSARAAQTAASIPPAASGMNLLVLLTDQERAVQWFPEGWAEANLPAMNRLRANGVSFSRAYTSCCQCTPARNALFTGLFPAQHGSFQTLTEDFPQSHAESQLNPDLPNLATVLKSAGYDVVYKGKWHMSNGARGADGEYEYDDISRYGFDSWNPPDGGIDPESPGALNDERYVSDAIAFLEDRIANPRPKPFCLVLSLVNPHDVWSYPARYQTFGYTDDPWLNETTPPIDFPPSMLESLEHNFKPRVHHDTFVEIAKMMLPLPLPQMRKNYINFYANLMRHVDSQLGRVLDVFENAGEAGQEMFRNTLVVRTSDHGEMAMCHGGLRQKTFNCYEETIRVPLVWSNPELFPEGRESPHLVSHVDFMPTLCTLLGIPNAEQYDFAGVDYSSLILDPDAPAVQDYVLFTYDDINAGQSVEPDMTNGLIPPPNRIQMILDTDYKFARYYDGEGVEPDEEEFYDLRPASRGGTDTDAATGEPVELRNISEWADSQRAIELATVEQKVKRAQMKQRLAAAAAERLQVRPPQAPVKAEDVTIKTATVTDEQTNETTDWIELKFYSRAGSNYQLQRSTGLNNWTDIGDPVPGNNGPIIMTQPLSDDRAFYRVVATAG